MPAALLPSHFPQLWKQIAWPDPGLSCEVIDQQEADEREGDAEGSGTSWRTTIRVRARRYARFVHLDVEPVSGLTFSDNFFDLVGGDERVVEIVSPQRFNADAVRIGHWLTPWT